MASISRDTNMIHRIRFGSSRSHYVFLALIIGIPVGGLAVTFLVHRVIGAILLLVGAFFSYQFAKYLQLHLKSFIETNDEGLRALTSSREKVKISWDEITHAGHCTDTENHEYVFVYDENNDTLLTVPDEFTLFRELVDELESRMELERYSLKPGETVTERLKQLLT
ncbi:MAG: hypothetical protein EA426_13570 [Spirochaetaceae bacterium]|nr:MAG: hypothetical protein EA426_13570 [Spirochaetaceae bacterium]